ncbi:MAG TPA: alpha/beta hydrolase [Candidatus Limnocylindrales bacterium]|nr:alpha/beta hydrolase [Candidatus Limnocylindrales bacterium]
MPRIAANGIEIEYETFGASGNPPLLLIMGLAAQMILWEDDFCSAIADRGFSVTRFDNRDIGKSTWITEGGVPDVGAALIASMSGQKADAPYTLSDMAADTAALLDGLGIRSAHIVGASMGGMIAQTLAIEHPAKVRTLTSIMSTTGNPALPPATPEAMAVLLSPPVTGREENIERAVSVFRTIGSPGFAFDEAMVRDIAGRSFDRGFHPEGVARQLVAILASGNRKERLASVRVPTLVIHGNKDPLVPFEGGVDTAESIPGAKLVEIDGMGHDFPRAVWPRIIDEICALAARA